MTNLRIVIAASLLLLACNDGGGQGGNVDASSGGSACTNAVYDPCSSNDQCSSNNCHLFQQVNLMVCVATCTPGNDSTCPVDKTGTHGMCNNMGVCKPAAANDCTR